MRISERLLASLGLLTFGLTACGGSSENPALSSAAVGDEDRAVAACGAALDGVWGASFTTVGEVRHWTVGPSSDPPAASAFAGAANSARAEWCWRLDGDVWTAYGAHGADSVRVGGFGYPEGKVPSRPPESGGPTIP